eukprot:4378-Rhodomonas_salina.2
MFVLFVQTQHHHRLQPSPGWIYTISVWDVSATLDVGCVRYGQRCREPAGPIDTLTLESAPEASDADSIPQRWPVHRKTRLGTSSRPGSRACSIAPSLSPDRPGTTTGIRGLHSCGPHRVTHYDHCRFHLPAR